MDDQPTRARAATTEQGSGRDCSWPPAPDPLHPVADNHCHLDIADGEWLATADAVRAAAAVNVTRIVQIGCGSPGARWAVEAAATHPALVAAVALHPNEAPRLAARGALDEALSEIERMAAGSERGARDRGDWVTSSAPTLTGAPRRRASVTSIWPSGSARRW
ncbi:MAG: TatD family hydrolase [Nocardioides sp.]